MKLFASAFALLTLLTGCGPASASHGSRVPLKLDELAVAVRGTPRNYLLTDKTGGFLVGEIAPRGGQKSVVWSVAGRSLLDNISLQINTKSLGNAVLDSGNVWPHQVNLYYSDGTVETLWPLEGLAEGSHGLAVEVVTPGISEIALQPALPPPLHTTIPVPQGPAVIWNDGQRTLTLSAGPACEAVGGGVVVHGTSRAAFLLLSSAAGQTGPEMESLWAKLDSFREARKARMEQLLEASYFRSSDAEVTRGMCWIKLSLDALVVKGGDTLAAGGIPWDGALDGRANAVALPGLGLATGDYAGLASMCRTLLRWQETRQGVSAYGRIPDRVLNGLPTYRGADVAPWFARNLYDYVTCTNDTSLLRDLYPALKRSIDGTLKYHTDSHNLLVHGDGETWMNAMANGKTLAPRGDRAVEIQLLWQFQQMIGSFTASFVDDSPSSSLWKSLAKKTEASFNKYFIDTTRNLVFDHVQSNGKGASDPRPNPLFCLEILGSEVVQQNMIKTIVNRMVYEYGVGTLAYDDPGFRPSERNSLSYNGPVATWLVGQLTYALTRYDRQDLAYRITRRLLHHALERETVGTLPEMFAVTTDSNEAEPQGMGGQASLSGMAEFIRSIFQDYLGVRIDAPSHLLTFEPKIPAELTDIDFTIRTAGHPVQVQYQKEKSVSRMILFAPDLDRDYDINYLWIMDDGSGWRGMMTLSPGVPLTIVFGPEEVLAYQGEKNVPVPGVQHLKGFSLRDSFTGLEFARPQGVPGTPRE